MKFGVREAVDVVFRATANDQKLGSRTYYKGEPMLYFDTLKASTLEGSSTPVYATGGRGNNRLVTWEGEKTLTFTFEDALISLESFSILSGSDIVEAGQTNDKGETHVVYQHMYDRFEVKDGVITIPGYLACWVGTITGDDAGDYKHAEADIFVMKMQGDDVVSENSVPASVEHKDGNTVITPCGDLELKDNDIVLVDFYVKHITGAAEVIITPDKFGGYFYIEGSTLFRREEDGKDLPAELVIPKGKVQSSFSLSMSPSGDPSTFTFTVDAMPGYTRFDQTKKILAALQIIGGAVTEEDTAKRTCEVTTGE